MDFGVSLSGLNAASADIAAISNNIANASTVGFKTVLTDFAASYLPDVNGTSPDPGGAGVVVEQTTQLFSQGTIASTSNALDVAINGNGFFVLADSANTGQQKFTRNGQFQIDAQGYLVASNGLRVQGYPANGLGGVLNGVVSDIKIPTNQSPPTVTSKVSGVVNLDSRSTMPVNAASFNPTDSLSYNNSSSVTIYDSLGTPHTLTNYYQLPQTSTTPSNVTWNVFTYMDGQPVSTGTPTLMSTSDPTKFTNLVPATISASTAASSSSANAGDLYNLTFTDGLGNYSVTDSTTNTTTTGSLSGNVLTLPNGMAVTLSAIPQANETYTLTQSASQLSFDGTGALVGVVPEAAAGAGRPSTSSVQMQAVVSNGAASPMSFYYDFAGSTQFGSNFGINALSQNGVGPGTLASYSFNSDGTLNGTYSNGKSQSLGQLVLTNFVNPNGLARDGDNTWVVSSLSGLPQTPVPPGSGGTGVVTGSATESSNVDLTTELVNLITAQRNYQASAQAIKTTDQVIQSLNNI